MTELFERWPALEQLNSSVILLGSFALAVVLLGLLLVSGLLVRWVRLGVNTANALASGGFRLWKWTLAWVPWPLFLVAVLAGNVAALSLGPHAELGIGGVLLILGVISCLAFIHLDTERYEVARGYKVLAGPLKGQDLAIDLIRYGPRAGLPLLAVASIAVVLGFTLLNEGLYRTVGTDWYRLTTNSHSVVGGAVGGEPVYLDFLAYTLLNLVRVVDLIDVANGHQYTHLVYVQQAKWPAGTLLVLFRTFFMVILLRQIFTAIRHSNLLGESIAEFWSPHVPIRERARLTVAQHGPAALRPLFRSLGTVTVLTPEQRQEVPRFLAGFGQVAIPLLLRQLRKPREYLRWAAVRTLGELGALQTLPRLRQLVRDPSELVRLGLVETLAAFTATGPDAVRKAWTLQTGQRPLTSWWRRLLNRPLRLLGLGTTDPVEQVAHLLAELLADPAPQVRQQAAAVLGELGTAGRPARARLLLLLSDPDESLRCQAAETLGKIGPQNGELAALQTALQDGSPLVRAAAAHALAGRVQASPEALPAVLPLLRDGTPEVREAATRLVAQGGEVPQEVTQQLEQDLTHSDNQVRAQAVEIIGAIGSTTTDTIPPLVQALADPSEQVRLRAAEALARLGPAAAEAAPALITALQDSCSGVAACAAATLGTLDQPNPATMTALAQALSHVNPGVRARSAEALSRLDQGGQTLPQLRAALQDSEGEVRRAALLAVARIDSNGGGLRLCLQALRDDPDWRVRQAAIQALSTSPPDAEVCAALVAACADGSDAVKTEVAATLGQCSDTDAAVPALLQLVDDDSPEVRLVAARALGRLGQKAAAAVPGLTQAFGGGNLELRRQVVRSLALIAPEAAVPVFAAALDDADEEMRVLASAALVKAPELTPELTLKVIDGLRDPAVQVRSNAAMILSRQDPLPPEAVQPLIECLKDPDDGLRLHAVRALSKAAEITPALERLLHDPNANVRLAAAQRLLVEDPGHAGAMEVAGAGTSA